MQELLCRDQKRSMIKLGVHACGQLENTEMWERNENNLKDVENVSQSRGHTDRWKSS